MDFIELETEFHETKIPLQYKADVVRNVKMGNNVSIGSSEQQVPPPGCGGLLLLIFTLQALKCSPDLRHHLRLITAVAMK